MTAFKIRQVTMQHEGGTKEYRVCLVTRRGHTEPGLVILCWGKIGTSGQIQTFRGTGVDVSRLATDKIREKQKRGYKVDTDSTVETSSEKRFAHSAHPFFHRIEAADRAYILADVEWDEEDDIGDVEVELGTGFTEVETELAPEEKAESSYRENDNWGMF